MTSWRRMCVVGVTSLMMGGLCPRLPGQQTVAVETEKAKTVQDDPLLAGTEQFAQGSTDVTEVTLDKKMMAMAAQFMDKSDAEAQRLMRNMEFVNVKSFEYGKEARYRMADLEQFRGRMDGSWSHVVKQRSETEATDVWMRADESGQLSELMVIAAEPKQLTFVHLKGHMTMEELTRAGASYGVPQGDGKLKPRGK